MTASHVSRRREMPMDGSRGHPPLLDIKSSRALLSVFKRIAFYSRGMGFQGLARRVRGVRLHSGARSQPSLLEVCSSGLGSSESSLSSAFTRVSRIPKC